MAATEELDMLRTERLLALELGSTVADAADSHMLAADSTPELAAIVEKVGFDDHSLIVLGLVESDDHSPSALDLVDKQVEIDVQAEQVAVLLAGHDSAAGSQVGGHNE